MFSAQNRDRIKINLKVLQPKLKFIKKIFCYKQKLQYYVTNIFLINFKLLLVITFYYLHASIVIVKISDRVSKDYKITFGLYVLLFMTFVCETTGLRKISF